MMTRRALFIALLAILWPQGASADLAGSRRQRAANRRCAAMGRAYERRGLTERERAKLEQAECHQVEGKWLSRRVFQA